MKKKKLVILVLTGVLAVSEFTGCGDKKDSFKVTIGIGQFAEHGSLDNCRKGFIEGLKEEGYVEGDNLKITTMMVTHNLRVAVEYGDRLVMMHKGNVVLDVRGEEKRKTDIDDILDKFNKISIECGN